MVDFKKIHKIKNKPKSYRRNGLVIAVSDINKNKKKTNMNGDNSTLRPIQHTKTYKNKGVNAQQKQKKRGRKTEQKSNFL